MQLSVREAATLLRKSSRAVRAQVARGELPGTKRDGRWYVDGRKLPLTEAQRRALQQKADAVRQMVDEALPSRMAATLGHRGRSIADLDGFRLGAEVLAAIRADTSAVLDAAVREQVGDSLEQALLALAEAVQQFDRELKVAAAARARAGLARAVGMLFIGAGIPPAEPVHSWVVTLETEVIPAVAGFARWAEGLRGAER